MGSVAYKLALVAAGLADGTFTLTPKNEWAVTARAALVQSAGGFVTTLEKTDLTAIAATHFCLGFWRAAPLEDAVARLP